MIDKMVAIMQKAQKNLVKLGLILITLILSLSLTSCKKIKDYADMNHIVYKSILLQEGRKEDDGYLVYIYEDNCSNCQQLKDLILNYANIAKKNSNKMPLYVLNISNQKVNKGLVKNDDEYDDFTNTTNYEDIHISATPVLITVRGGKVIKLISSKTTLQPVTQIKSYINNLIS